MWMRATALMLLAVAVAGCATTSASRDAGWFPSEARSDPTHHLVVTVRNGANGAALGVGSTPRGYGSVTAYAATREARERAHELEKRYRLHAVASWPISVLDVYCLVYRIDGDSDRDTLLAALRRDPRVESAQPLTAFSAQGMSSGGTTQNDTGPSQTGYNDTYARLQRNLAELAVPQAQQWSKGEGVRIAIIDTGIALDHSDLRGQVASWRNFIDADAERFKRDRHGTAVAGVIAAVANNNVGIVGIAPEVKLVAYKACWETNASGGASCNTFTLARALVAAIDARVDIVNLSLAGPSDPLLTRLARAAQRAGIILVGAAGPDGMGFPVDIEGVIGVDALESAHATRGLIDAPGQDIFTLTPADHYDAASGSSLAAAEVSAVVALLRARDPRVGAERVRTLLQASTRPVTTSSGMREMINACEAMTSLARNVRCQSPDIPAFAEGPRFRR